MNTLITGGAGYLGSVLVPKLLQLGHTVTIFDKVFNNDVRDLEDLRAALKTTDTVVHLAAVVGQKACDADPLTAVEVNVHATRRLVALMSPNQLLMYPCTNSGYGIGSEEPCTEESPLNPISLYGRTKVEGERIAMEHKSAISLRFATLFGPSPKMRWDLLVNYFVREAVKRRVIQVFEGHFRRNFLHVKDAARAIEFLITNQVGLRGQVYNAGDARLNMTKLRLAQRVAYEVDRIDEGPTVLINETSGSDPDQRDYVVSSAKLMTFGWRPTHTLAEGIEDMCMSID